MPVFFWRTLGIYRPKYKALVRVESIEFDPLVNRYFESEYKAQKDSKNTGSTTTSDKSNSNSTDTIESKTESSDESSSKSGSEGSSEETFDGTVINNNKSSITTAEKGTDSTEKAGTRILSKEGSIIDAKTGKEIYNKDTSDTTTYGHEIKFGGSDSTTVTDDTNVTTSVNANTTTKNATKEAPMSDVGVTSKGGNSDGKLGNLDFQYATAYAQTDSDAGTDTTVKGNKGTTETLLNKGTTETHSNSDTIARSGSDSTEFDNRKDITSYDNYAEKETYDKYTDTVTYGKNTTVTNNGEDNKTTDNHTDNIKTNQTTEASSSGSGASETKASNTNVMNGTHSGATNTLSKISDTETNRNRYTGREGLTPQKAMAEASDYLMGYSPAFQWLVDRLEPCFMAVYDI